MQKGIVQLVVTLLLVGPGLRGQDREIDRLITGELKMTFPGIYFRHNSTDYATMPYTVDSCFKYIRLHIKDINSLVIWRDSSETEQLTNKRIKKLKMGLDKFRTPDDIYIESMGKAQKIAQRTIAMGSDSAQIQYLLSLNSVFDISNTRFPAKRKEKNHIERPRLSCWGCWKSGFHLQTRWKLRKILKRNKQKTL